MTSLSAMMPETADIDEVRHLKLRRHDTSYETRIH